MYVVNISGVEIGRERFGAEGQGVMDGIGFVFYVGIWGEIEGLLGAKVGERGEGIYY